MMAVMAENNSHWGNKYVVVFVYVYNLFIDYTFFLNT